jgi:hypothetical protein
MALEKHPYILAAEQALIATNANIGVAKAAIFRRFRNPETIPDPRKRNFS